MNRLFARLMLALAPFALLAVLIAPTANAQSIDGDPIGDGALFVLPDIEPNPNGDTGLDTTTTGGTGGGDASPGLAVTGSEVEPIMAVSIGLLALGGSVLVTSRRRLSTLD